MVTIKLRVADDRIDASVEEASWHMSYAQTMTVGAPDKWRGRRQVLGFAGRGDLAGATPGSIVVRVFDPSQFDPDLAVAATRFVCWKAQEGIGRSALRIWFTRPRVNLAWPDWDELSGDARLAYLRGSGGSRGVVSFADVVVNGGPATTRSLARRLLGWLPLIGMLAIVMASVLMRWLGQQ